MTPDAGRHGTRNVKPGPGARPNPLPAGRHHAPEPSASRARRPARNRPRYERGTTRRWHYAALARAADTAVAAMPMPLRLLDVGCGDGKLLGELVVRVPAADLYVGVDPLPEMLTSARRESDLRISFVRAAAESLPFPDASFDLVVASFSFAYWADQRAGTRELSRVVATAGKVVLVDTTVGRSPHKGGVHTGKHILAMLTGAGLHLDATEALRRSPVGCPTVRAFIASR